jgi:tetratricopeptide (TPR) repeat protein
MWRLALVLLFPALILGCGGESADKYAQEGVAYFQQQKYDEAIASYQKAINLDPKAAGVYNLLGMAYRFKYNQLGNPEFREKEITAFRRALEVDPNFWVAMINLGATYYYMGEKAKAAPLFKKALELNPTHPEKAEIEKLIVEGENQS